MGSPPSNVFALSVIVLAFAVSRTTYLALGNHFVANVWFWQFVSPVLLKFHLLQSLFYLHSQPPILNLILGVGLKISPFYLGDMLQALFMALGIGLATGLFLLMREMGLPGWPALLTTLIFEVSPATLGYENWFFDTYPTAFLLCFATFYLTRFLKREHLLDGALFATTLALLVLVSSKFQMIWFVGVLAVLWLVRGAAMRKLLPASSVLFAIILLLYLKNFLLFGTFTSSSWLGMNLATTTTAQLSFPERCSTGARRQALASRSGALVPSCAWR